MVGKQTKKIKIRNPSNKHNKTWSPAAQRFSCCLQESWTVGIYGFAVFHSHVKVSQLEAERRLMAFLPYKYTFHYSEHMQAWGKVRPEFVRKGSAGIREERLGSEFVRKGSAGIREEKSGWDLWGMVQLILWPQLSHETENLKSSWTWWAFQSHGGKARRLSSAWIKMQINMQVMGLKHSPWTTAKGKEVLESIRFGKKAADHDKRSIKNPAADHVHAHGYHGNPSLLWSAVAVRQSAWRVKWRWCVWGVQQCHETNRSCDPHPFNSIHLLSWM